MDGCLLKQGHVVKSWQKRFFRLDAANCVLEYFMDHTLLERRGKIILSDADVKMGDEIGLIGEGIASPADTRRFVFRVVDGHTKRPVDSSVMRGWMHFMLRSPKQDGPPLNHQATRLH
ncbi:unnamed protein product [Aphanomyces euteiches]